MNGAVKNIYKDMLTRRSYPYKFRSVYQNARYIAIRQMKDGFISMETKYYYGDMINEP